MSRYSIYLIAITAVIGLPSGLKAQAAAPPPRQMYCTGIATRQPLRHDTYIISGPQSDARIVYSQGERVFFNKGSRQGMKVGDQMLVYREESEPLPFPWFTGQQDMARSMGIFLADIGRLRVVAVQDRTSIAEITLACDQVQRGDVVEPFVERPAPPYKSDPKLDLYAPPSGKAKGSIAFDDQFGELLGVGRIAYVNLGTGAGVKVGDYLRVYRYQGETIETEFNYPDMQYSTKVDGNYGLGSAPKPYSSAELPRDILGEGIVLRVSPTSAAVLITNSHVEIYPGDYVEIE